MRIKLKRNTVLGPGKIGKAGKEYEVNDRDGRYLIGIGKAVDPTKGKSGEKVVTVDELVEAIDQLNPEDTDSWTAGNKPTTDALAEIVGAKVSAKLRDEAFELYEAE